MSTNYGRDLSSMNDVDPSRVVSGVELVAQDTLWRLRTPHAQGILEEEAPDYGFDLEGAIGTIESPADAAALPDKIKGELSDDERILSTEAVITRTVNGPAVEYDIAIHCVTADGPFDIVGKAGVDGFSIAAKLLPGGT